MVVRGRVRNGVVVLDDGAQLPEGQEVTVMAVPSQAAREALEKLIGIWKTDSPPTDEQVERLVERERMKKYA